MRALQAENFNSVNLKSNQTLFEYKVLPKSRKNSYKSAQNIKTAENLSPKVNEKNVESTEKLTPKINEQDVRNLKNLFSETNASKRKIYVFHNLEINGTLYSNEVNNLGWKTLNNTLRKVRCLKD